MDDHRSLAAIIARLNAAYKAGTISVAQWGRLVACAISEFKT
jgi:hypothetical protein